MTTAASVAPPRPQGSPWFRSPVFDLLLILAVPYFTWPLVMAGQERFGAETLKRLILLTATGHYFATFVRTYGDLELFQRFKVRFLVTPVVLLVSCVWLVAAGYKSQLLLVTSSWALWHWLAQAFGFARIYDIKVGSYRRWTTYLDKALVVMGFLGAVVLIPGSISFFGGIAQGAGLPLPAADRFAAFQNVVIGAIGLVVILYVHNLARTIARGEPWSWQKQFMHVTTIGYYWFAYAYLPNVLVAYVLYELFHDIQYYAITWLTGRGRVRRSGVAGWFSMMFRPSWVAAAGFTIAMCAFGAVDVFARNEWFPEGEAHEIWIALILVFALLHYYYDGFIWKAREGTLGADLGIKGGLRDTFVPGLRHAAWWLFFFLPIPLLAAYGRGPLPKREQLAELVALSPHDFAKQAEYAYELTRARELDEALAHYARSIEENPNYAIARANYGSALDLAGDLAGAAEQYRAALACRDYEDAHAIAHLNLGVILLLEGNRPEAEEHFAAAKALGAAASPIARMMSLADAIPAEATERRAAYYRAVLELDPDVHEARGRLAEIQLARGELREAKANFDRIAKASPGSIPALVGLATAELELNEVEEARAIVRRLLTMAPGDERVRDLARRVGL